METIISTTLSTLTGLIIGYLIKGAKSLNQRETNEKTTLQALLRNAITSKYYIYTELGSIPDYERRNLIYLHEEYKKWKGNSYVNQIVDEMLKLPIKNKKNWHFHIKYYNSQQKRRRYYKRRKFGNGATQI